ncbi:MAG: E3 binding domain-containing protein, partial [Chloroflexi bacterium]|nr:E3 binding domain-containing protein [Chloroflexota bacterium]
MPQMGYDMEQGTVVRWIKREGDEVKRGEPLAEIETDKAVVEMESHASGVLRKVLVEEGVPVPVGQVIGIIGAADEDISDLEVVAVVPTTEAKAAPIEASPAPAVAAPAVGQASPARAGEIKASPVARRLAQEKGIDLSQVTGTGPGGRVVREDVLAFEAAATPVAPEAARVALPAAVPVGEMAPGRVDLSRMRQAIARSTAQ